MGKGLAKEGYEKLTPSHAQSGTIADIDISAMGTTACGPAGHEVDMTMAEGTVGSDDRKLADGYRKRTGTG